MSRTRVNTAYAEIDGQALDDVVDIEITDERADAEAQPTMTRAGRALGYRKGQRTTSFTINSLISVPREYDWHSLLRYGTEFLFVYEEEISGKRWIARDCLVTRITKGHSQADGATESIECLCLEHIPEP